MSGGPPRLATLLAGELRRCTKRRLLRHIPITAAMLMGIVVAGSSIYGTTYDGHGAVVTMQYVTRYLIPLSAAVGAAIQGSWFASGTVSAVLVVEPRRSRVLVAQGVAVCAVAGSAVVLVQIVVLAGLASWAWLGGHPIPAASYRSCVVQIAFTSLACVASVWLGAAVATITRAATAAVAIVLVGFLVAEPVVMQLVMAASHHYVGGLLPLGSLVESVVPAPETAVFSPPGRWLPPFSAVLWLVGATATAMWCQGRRDLT